MKFCDSRYNFLKIAFGMADAIRFNAKSRIYSYLYVDDKKITVQVKISTRSAD